jgi:hypothetical protein
MSRCLPFGELLHVTEIQARIGEWQACHRLIEIDGKCVPVVVARLYFHAKRPERFKITIKPTDVKPQSAKDLLAC